MNQPLSHRSCDTKVRQKKSYSKSSAEILPGGRVGYVDQSELTCRGELIFRIVQDFATEIKKIIFESKLASENCCLVEKHIINNLTNRSLFAGIFYPRKKFQSIKTKTWQLGLGSQEPQPNPHFDR